MTTRFARRAKLRGMPAPKAWPGEEVLVNNYRKAGEPRERGLVLDAVLDLHGTVRKQRGRYSYRVRVDATTARGWYVLTVGDDRITRIPKRREVHDEADQGVPPVLA